MPWNNSITAAVPAMVALGAWLFPGRNAGPRRRAGVLVVTCGMWLAWPPRGTPVRPLDLGALTMGRCALTCTT